MRFALRTSLFALAAAWGSLPAVQAGYEQPCYIDGCQSVDGRYSITAAPVELGRTVHGPHRWNFIWKDNYTVLEFRVVAPRSAKDKSGRLVRVSLTDGRLLAMAETPDDPAKVPVCPFRDDDQLPHSSAEWKESYAPSLDPVRQPGTFRIQTAAEARPVDTAPKLPPFPYGGARLIHDGYQKADTPAWLPDAAGRKVSGVVFTDLERRKLYLFTPPDSVTEVRADLSRGKVGPDRRLYAVQWLPAETAAEQAEPLPVLASWRPGEEPRTIVEQAAGGRELSLNDLAVSSRGLVYFTTLKDPDKGRLSVVDPTTRTVRVLFDGELEPTLCNPNGLALSHDERFLFVGISHYKNRKHSGVYCFPLLADGTLDVQRGKGKPWAAVPGPDGIAVDRAGNVFFTAGGVVEAFDRYGRRWGSIKIPRGSGTNLCFGGERGETLYVTTFNALYVVEKNSTGGRQTP